MSSLSLVLPASLARVLWPRLLRLFGSRLSASSGWPHKHSVVFALCIQPPRSRARCALLRFALFLASLALWGGSAPRLPARASRALAPRCRAGR